MYLRTGGDKDEDSSTEGASQSESNDEEGEEEVQTAHDEQREDKQSRATEGRASKQGVCRHRDQEIAHAPSTHAAMNKEALDNGEGEWVVTVLTGEVVLGYSWGLEGNAATVEMIITRADSNMRGKIARTGEVTMWQGGDVKRRQVWARRQHRDRQIILMPTQEVRNVSVKVGRVGSGLAAVGAIMIAEEEDDVRAWIREETGRRNVPSGSDNRPAI